MFGFRHYNQQHTHTHVLLTSFMDLNSKYRRGTALQGALVLAKSGKLELRDNNFTDIIRLSSITVR